MLRVRLAMLYDASLGELKALIEEGSYDDPLTALPATLEWAFLASIIRIRLGEKPDNIGHRFQRHSGCKSARINHV